MKLILLTSPDFFVEEDKILTTLFEEGLDILHFRKPNSEPVFCERLLSLMPEQYRSKIVVHDHFYLRDEFGLMGIHLSKRNPQAPASYTGPVTRTCYDLKSTQEQKPSCQYILLRNIFDSISESENKASFTSEELRNAARQGIIDRKVIAEGGVSLENIEQVREWGFGGVAIRGDLWNRFDIHSGRDYKELIAHFRKLRKAVG
ncbi:MAG: thiamine phosphate synthase [Bacteroidaceae bacterium]|nr:thiamine phosphate synthase [Bacteroidaceae bacterium]